LTAQIEPAQDKRKYLIQLDIFVQ